MEPLPEKDLLDVEKFKEEVENHFSKEHGERDKNYFNRRKGYNYNN